MFCFVYRLFIEIKTQHPSLKKVFVLSTPVFFGWMGESRPIHLSLFCLFIVFYLVVLLLFVSILSLNHRRLRIVLMLLANAQNRLSDITKTYVLLKYKFGFYLCNICYMFINAKCVLRWGWNSASSFNSHYSMYMYVLLCFLLSYYLQVNLPSEVSSGFCLFTSSLVNSFTKVISTRTCIRIPYISKYMYIRKSRSRFRQICAGELVYF